MKETGTVIRIPTGQELPLVASPAQFGRVIGKSDRAVRGDCESGAIQTLPRSGGDGGHWRIPTAKQLDAIGMPYEFVAASRSTAS